MVGFERRDMERFDLELPTLLSVTEENGKQQTFEVTSKNICAGGAFFKTDNPLPVGTDVKMDLIVHLEKFKTVKGNGTHIDVSGSVIRTNDQGMAVCFDTRYRIGQYLS